jgi:hypothetical protein
MKLHRSVRLLILVATLGTLPPMAIAQSLAVSADSPGLVAATSSRNDFAYVRPSQETKVRNYFFDAFGPYPFARATGVAAIGQMDNTPAAWQQGVAGYSRRFGSDLGVAAISTTTRYALGEAFREDTLYYRCECKGILPRMGHAVLSSVTARHGADGHRAFSYSAFAAPYAGTLTAVYAWYPDNYGARAALRMGNYNLLGSVGENLWLEFFYSGPHSLLTRMHLNDRHAAPTPEQAK